MKRIALLRSMMAVAVLCAVASPASAQQSTPHVSFKAIPLHHAAASATAAVGAATANSLPMWSYSTTASRDGLTYHGKMVGRSPFFHGARTTNINTILIPVAVTITNANDETMVFDPTQPDPACLPNETATAVSLAQQSPILTAASFTMNGVDEGSTQYVDAFQRASFFDAVNPTGDSYHTLLNLTKTVPVVSMTMNSPAGAIADGTCGKVGVVDINTLDVSILPAVLADLVAQGVGPTTLPVFLLYNVVMTEGPPNQEDPFSNCCILGFHSGLLSQAGTQLFAIADYDSSGVFNAGAGLDIAVLSHEIAELVDDPLVNNAAPAWGHVGQIQGGCQADLEVGDPLSGTYFPSVTMPNGVTYHPQEMAFFSWFFGAPSIAAGGLFSNNGAFDSDAGPICQ